MNFKIGDRVGRPASALAGLELGWFLGTVVQIMDREKYKYCVRWDTAPIKLRMHQGDDLVLIKEPNQIIKDIL